MQQICVDTGFLSIYFSKDCSKDVQEVMDKAKEKKIEIHILNAVLCEVYYQICKIEGKDSATLIINSFLNKFKPFLIELDESLIYSTGLLKCQHSTSLSYIDCMSIAYCQREKISFHTTEKKIKMIPHNTLQKLKVVKYRF